MTGDPLALGCCANCKHWLKIASLPFGLCELYKAKGLHKSPPVLEATQERLKGTGTVVFFTPDRAVCSEWEVKP